MLLRMDLKQLLLKKTKLGDVACTVRACFCLVVIHRVFL